MSLNRFTLSIIPQARTINSIDEVPAQVFQDDEMYYDYNSMTWMTASSAREIKRLNEELKQKKERDKKNLQSIISYYYKR